MTSKRSVVAEELVKAADLYDEKNEEYGDSYKRFGGLMTQLFPDGVTLQSEKDFNRFGVLTLMMTKTVRYTNNFEYEGHNDSLDDLTVYTQMLKEIDNE